MTTIAPDRQELSACRLEATPPRPRGNDNLPHHNDACSACLISPADLTDSCLDPAHDTTGGRMIIRDILVHLDSTPRAAVRLELAVQLAMRTEGYVIGLYTGRRPEDRSYDELPDIPTTGDDFHAWIQQQGVGGEWRLTGGSPVEAIIAHGRCADLIVVGQCDPDSRRDDLPERALVEIIGRVGRPVLAVPYAGSFSKVATRILVAWDGRPESTRAIHEALPLLSNSGAVRVLVYNPRRLPDVAVSAREAVRLHLSRHGIPADVAPLPDARPPR